MRDFNHTIGVLVKAYLNDTLQHLNCHACAVGNMIADANNIQLVRQKQNGCIIWSTGKPHWFSGVACGYSVPESKYFSLAKEQAETTGYTIEEIARIEVEFERANCDEDGYEGLMRVVDVLAEIHSIDLTEKESAKALFVKA